MPVRSNKQNRSIRHERIRKHLSGNADRPRLSVYRSLKHISVQLIDDASGTTLAAASSLEKEAKAGGNKNGAQQIGELIARRAKEKGITQAVFDRGGFRYAGRVAALAEAARKAGLKF